MSAFSAKFKEQVLSTFSNLTYLATAAGAIAAAYLLTPLAAGAVLVAGVAVGGIAQISAFKYRNEGEVKETAEGTAKGNKELVRILESQQEKLAQINEKLARIESHAEQVSSRRQESYRGIA